MQNSTCIVPGGISIPEGMTVGRVNLDEVLLLRRGVLRAHLPPEASHFNGDERAIHVGTYHAQKPGVREGRILGGLSFILNPSGQQFEWQLRGMAVFSGHQRKGLGRLVLAWAENAIWLSSPHHDLCCEARMSAVPFFRKCGWLISSPPYPKNDVGEQFGPWILMTKKLKFAIS